MALIQSLGSENHNKVVKALGKKLKANIESALLDYYEDRCQMDSMRYALGYHATAKQIDDRIASLMQSFRQEYDNVSIDVHPIKTQGDLNNYTLQMFSSLQTVLLTYAKKIIEILKDRGEYESALICTIRKTI